MDFELSNHEAHSNNVELGKRSFVNQELDIRDKGSAGGFSPKHSKCSIDWSLPNNAQRGFFKPTNFSRFGPCLAFC